MTTEAVAVVQLTQHVVTRYIDDLTARDRLMDQAVETLMTGYFDDGQWTRSEVSTAVDLACGGSLAD